MVTSSQREATRQRERYKTDAAYRDLRKQRAREYYAAHRLEICRRTYMKLVDSGAIKRPRQLEKYQEPKGIQTAVSDEECRHDP
jgi:hypothetical protein